MNEYDDYPPEEPERPPDPAVAAAAERLRAFLEDQPRRLFYSTQIETSLERDFFHWITGKALIELAESQEIQRSSEEVQRKQVNFYANRRHRYWRREQREMIELLERILDPEFAQAVGRHGELMFDAAPGRPGFAPKHATRERGGERRGFRTRH